MKRASNSILAQQVCVTGSIGSGKSRVSHALARMLNLSYIDVDELAKEVMGPNGKGLAAIKNYNTAFINDGRLDRSVLRQAIFNSASVKNDIDALIHPLIHSLLLERITALKTQTLIEIPLLFETGWDAWFNVIIAVYAKKDTCLERIMIRDNVSKIDAEKAFKSQIDPLIKRAKATHVIENDGDWQTTLVNIRRVAASF